MKRYAVIYREPGHRTRSMSVEAESVSTIQTGFAAPDYFVEHVVDFEERRVIPCILVEDGILEVPDGDYGELTPSEYFIEKLRKEEQTEAAES